MEGEHAILVSDDEVRACRVGRSPIRRCAFLLGPSLYARECKDIVLYTSILYIRRVIEIREIRVLSSTEYVYSRGVLVTKEQM